MTTLAPRIGLTQGVSLVPDAERLLNPGDQTPVVSEPEPVVGPSERSSRLTLDAAVEASRRNTAPNVVEQRRVPRYSLRELNSLDTDVLNERLKQVRIDDNRPGWVKFLDLIDLPRNVVGNVVAETFLPAAKKAALERGDFDQAGLTKVYGSDILRAMGLENRVITATGGFLVDIFTDPLSFVGGPLGGLKTAGTRGAVQITKQGQRALRTGIKAVRQGRPVADDATRQMLETTERYGRATGQLADNADSVQIADYLQSTIRGDQGRVSRGAERLGLGGVTRGGTLAEDAFSVTRGTGPGGQAVSRTAEESARIEATKAFAARYTTNPGLDLSRARGGAQVAHIPLTTLTLTTPSFQIPGLGFRPGAAAATQRAFALAQEGNVQGGRAILAAQEDAQATRNAVVRMRDLMNERARLDRAAIGARALGSTPDPVSAARLAEIDEEIRLSSEAIPDLAANRALRQDQLAGTGSGPVDPNLVYQVDSVADVAAVSELVSAARADARVAEIMARWADEGSLLSQATADDIELARTWKRMQAEEISGRLSLNLAENSVDEVLSAARRDESLRALLDRRSEHASARLQSLIDLSDESLDTAEVVAEAFQRNIDAANEVAALSGSAARNLLDSDSRLLADAARRVLRLDDPSLGHMVFAPITRGLRRYGFQGSADRTQELGEIIARNLGGAESGTVSGMMQGFRRAASEGAKADADRAVSALRAGNVDEFEGLRGFDEIAGRFPAALYPDLSAYLTMRVGAAVDRRAGLPQSPILTRFGDDANPTPADQLVTRVREAGVLDDADTVREIDELAERMADVFERLGTEAVLRGDLDNTLSRYVPVQLSPEATAAVQRLARSDGGTGVRGAARALMEPDQARMTNLIEYVDDAGEHRSFTVLDAETVGKMSDDEIADLVRAGVEDSTVETIRAIRADIDGFKSQFGIATDAEMNRAMQIRSRALLPNELNEMAARGHFDALVGGRLVQQGEMWETDAMSLLSRRLRAERVREAEHALNEAVSPFVVTTIDPRIQASVQGKTALTRTGQKVTRLGQSNRYDIGGRTYRTLDSTKFDGDSILSPERVFGEDARNMLIPDVLATSLERAHDVMKPENIPPVMAMANGITSLFKITTLAHPSWTVANALGNALLLPLRHPDLVYNPRRSAEFMGDFRAAMGLVASRNTNRRIGAGTRVQGVGGRFMSPATIMREADAQGLINGGVAGDAQRQMMLGLISSRPLDAAEAVPGSLPARLRNRYNRRLAEYAAARGQFDSLSPVARRLDQLKAGASAIQGGPVSALLRAWFGVNGAIDDTFRLALFMNLRREGFDAATAGEEVRRTLLNFGDMTSAEKNYIRPLVPFYAWFRASAPNMLLRLFRDPKQIAVTPKLAEAFEELLAGEEAVPRHQRPRWLQETMAIQVGSDPETARSFLAGTLFPQEAAGQIAAGALGATGLFGFDGGDFMDMANWTLGQFSPVAKLPIELGTGREAFTGREIGAGEGAGDISLQQYLANQVRPFRELGIGSPGGGPIAREFGEGIGAGVSRLLVGGRASSNLDIESRRRALFSELKQREMPLRLAIRRADRRGDQEAGVRLRTDLLALYASHIERSGTTDGVPAWAVEDLRAGGLAIPASGPGEPGE